MQECLWTETTPKVDNPPSGWAPWAGAGMSCLQTEHQQSIPFLFPIEGPSRGNAKLFFFAISVLFSLREEVGKEPCCHPCLCPSSAAPHLTHERGREMFIFWESSSSLQAPVLFISLLCPSSAAFPLYFGACALFFSFIHWVHPWETVTAQLKNHCPRRRIQIV